MVHRFLSVLFLYWTWYIDVPPSPIIGWPTQSPPIPSHPYPPSLSRIGWSMDWQKCKHGILCNVISCFITDVRVGTSTKRIPIWATYIHDNRCIETQSIIYQNTYETQEWFLWSLKNWIHRQRRLFLAQNATHAQGWRSRHAVLLEVQVCYIMM